MAGMQDDLNDSRTLIVGRKRAFEETIEDQSTHANSDGEESGEERSHKRAKDSADGPNAANILEDHATDTLLALPTDLRLAAFQPSQNAMKANESRPPNGTKDSVASASLGSVAEQDPQTAVSGQMSWNKGVQSGGLRTSFGSKKARPTTVVELERDDDEEKSSHTDPNPALNANTEGKSSSDAESDSEDSDGGAQLDSESNAPRPKVWLKKMNMNAVKALPAAEKTAYRKCTKAVRSLVKRGIKPTEAGIIAEMEELAKNEPLSKKAKGSAKGARKGDSSSANETPIYPQYNGPQTLYQDSQGEFLLNEIVDKQGAPIPLQKLTAELFMSVFLESNRKNTPKNAGSCFRRAYGAYLSKFYSHAPPGALSSQRSLDKSIVNKEIKTLLKGTAGKATASQHFMLQSAVQAPTNIVQASFPGQVSIRGQPPVPGHASVSTQAPSQMGAFESGSQQSTGGGGGVDAAMGGTSLPNGGQPTSQPMSRTTSSDGEIMDIDLTEEQLALQRRYFPSSVAVITRETQHCLACARQGHDSTSCPALLCTCGARHSILRCPERQRCTKCLERGHSQDDCSEKLAAPKSEWQCELCGSRDHLEVACHLIWRSFDPRPEDIRKVRDIPISCYMCGSDRHYGTDCGLYRGPVYSGITTWSLANLQRFIDPASKDRALSAGVDYSIAPRDHFSIKGKGRPHDPIMFVDSDEEEEESFIRPKIQVAERGHIRFNNNNDSRSTGFERRRGASPVAPYRKDNDRGFRSEGDYGHGMHSEYPYTEQRPVAFQAAPSLQARPRHEGGLGGFSALKGETRSRGGPPRPNDQYKPRGGGRVRRGKKQG